MKNDVLRFITAGSVDDGKSTLIGRLLYDTRTILTDQLATLARSRHARVQASDAQIDLALLTDGLEAEREQGITIDVAYRYFATPQRKFIVADAPGHEQYTRNLVTGASQSDVAILLIDATRVDRQHTPVNLLDQTKRHAAIVRLLGIQHVAVAVNKMDLLDFDEGLFRSIEAASMALAAKLELPAPVLIPVSALFGDNIVHKSTRAPWYDGPSLLSWLEDLDINVERKIHHLRFPVQLVARQDGSSASDFRGYLGRVESGMLEVGQKVRVMPGSLEATVAEITVSNDRTKAQGSCLEAHAGQTVAVRLEEDLDISRGDMIVSAQDDYLPPAARLLSVDLCWLDGDILSLSRKYTLRHTSREVFTKVKSIERVLDVKTLSHATDIHALGPNDIGRVKLALQKPIIADTFDLSPATGAVILIDNTTHHTVAAGMIREAFP